MQHITLNLAPDLDPRQWAVVDGVFRGIDGWTEAADGLLWRGAVLGAPYRIEGSIEPGGLVLEADLPPALWTGWVSVLCARLSAGLGVAVHDAEM